MHRKQKLVLLTSVLHLLFELPSLILTTGIIFILNRPDYSLNKYIFFVCGQFKVMDRNSTGTIDWWEFVNYEAVKVLGRRDKVSYSTTIFFQLGLNIN
jgi:hypothetical protein